MVTVPATSSASPSDKVSTARMANTSEARPRGPSQPMRRTSRAANPDLHRASATGTMRTTVRLSTA